MKFITISVKTGFIYLDRVIYKMFFFSAIQYHHKVGKIYIITSYILLNTYCIIKINIIFIYGVAFIIGINNKTQV